MSEEKSKGLGHTVKKVTNALGIKQCGSCKKRQQKLNALFPYKSDEHKKTHEELVADNKKKHDEMLAALRNTGGL